MNLPEHFKLLGMDISIDYSERNRDHDYYCTDTEKCMISVHTEHAPQKVREMLFTALLLGGSLAYLKLDLADKTLYAISRIVWSIFMDNPVLTEGKVPERPRVMGNEYTIEEKVHLQDIDSGGRIDFGDLRLQLASNLNPRLKYIILWHEFLHEIMDLVDKEHNNEQNICGISNIIGDLVFNNDMSWMAEGID